MGYIIAGLGNPGDEYVSTRHNTGRMTVEDFAKKHDIGPFKENMKAKALVAKGLAGAAPVTLVLPNNFMNRSGGSLVEFVKSIKAAEKLIVIHDDLDLPLGTIKLSWNRGAGGHRGVGSIIKSLKTEGFIRIRVGISLLARGKIKKPTGEAVEKFIIGPFSKPELATLKKVSKTVAEALEAIIEKGVGIAMGEFN